MAAMVEEANGKTRQVLTCFLICPLYLSVVSALSVLFVRSLFLICPLALSYLSALSLSLYIFLSLRMSDKCWCAGGGNDQAPARRWQLHSHAPLLLLPRNRSRHAASGVWAHGLHLVCSLSPLALNWHACPPSQMPDLPEDFHAVPDHQDVFQLR